MVYSFGDIFKWSSGKPIEPEGGSIPVYGSNGVIGYTNKARYKNKIILGRVGAYCGSVNYCEGDFNATDNTLITTCDTGIIEYRYAYYLLKLFNLNKYAGGAAQPLITQSILKHLKCDIPPIETQLKVSGLLHQFDALIENNGQRIFNLELMAERLYKEWFVRFRFPGHEGTEMVPSKLGKLPTSFVITNMSAVFDYYIGGGWGNDDYSDEYPVEASVIRGADFPGVWRYDISSCPRRYHKISNYKSRQLLDGDIIMEISGGTAEQPVGRTVLVTQDMIERFPDGKVICASFCKLIRLKKNLISPFFFYYWMHYLYDTRIIDRFQLQSTGIINFKFESFLKKGLVMIPPKETMDAFDAQVGPIFKAINQYARQNELLSHQRDMLIPRLMSGKLEVK